MLEVPATEFAKRFSRYRRAARHESVAVTHHGRVTEGLVSKHDHDEHGRVAASAIGDLVAPPHPSASPTPSPARGEGPVRRRLRLHEDGSWVVDDGVKEGV